MIVSPRAKEIIDVLRKHGNGFIKIDEVLLYRRAGAGSPFRKVPYWKRSEDSNDPLPPKLTSFAIVPEMSAAVHRGFGISGNTLNNANAVNAWKAFDRSMQTSGSFGTYNSGTSGDGKYAWAMVSFPELRTVRGWALQFEYCYSNFWLAIEGRLFDGTWTRIFESSSVSPVNHGRFGAITTPIQCTAVRILTNYSSYPVRSCQFFDLVPLVPVTMSSNAAPAVELISEPTNYNLYRCFTEQSNAYTHGTAAWYFNGGAWRSNRGQVSTKDQNRFVIKFAEPQDVGGFSVGGLENYDVGYCYANCLLIEGRESDVDFWRPLGEVEFEPVERRSRYFDFAVSRMVTQLRITMQDVTHGTGASNSAPVYLPPMQILGLLVEPGIPPYSWIAPSNELFQTGQPSSSNVIIIEQDGKTFAVPITEP
jgi:hypothetical protein